jgi:hypothetical protein
MTNEQMIFCVLKEHTMTDREQLAMMAELKGKQFAQEKQALIDKACEWLKENVSKHCHGYYTFHKELMIEEFKQAMEGGRV